MATTPPDQDARTTEILERLDRWLDATEKVERIQAKRRRLRTLLVGAVALGAATAFLDLDQAALAVLLPRHPSVSELASRIATGSLTVAGAVLLIAEYLEPLAHLLAVWTVPALCALVLVATSLVAPDATGGLVALGLIPGFAALGLLALWGLVMQDIDTSNPGLTKFPGFATAFGRGHRGWRSRVGSVADPT